MCLERVKQTYEKNSFCAKPVKASSFNTRFGKERRRKKKTNNQQNGVSFLFAIIGQHATSLGLLDLFRNGGSKSCTLFGFDRCYMLLS